MKTTPNDSCLSGPILKMLWCFPLSPLWIATNRQQKQHLTSNPNPPTPQTHHLAATYHQGHHLHQPTFHHDHPTFPTAPRLPCQAPSGRSGAGLAGRVAEAHRSRGARDADGRGWRCCAAVRRWCSTFRLFHGGGGVYRGSFKKNVGEGGKRGEPH